MGRKLWWTFSACTINVHTWTREKLCYFPMGLRLSSPWHGHGHVNSTHFFRTSLIQGSCTPHTISRQLRRSNILPGLLARFKTHRIFSIITPNTHQGLHEMQLNNKGEEKWIMLAIWSLTFCMMASLWKLHYSFCIYCMKIHIQLLVGNKWGQMSFFVKHIVNGENPL